MSSAARPLIVPTAHPQLEEALRFKLERRVATAGGLGELVPLALRLGLIQGTLRPRLRQPQLLLFAGDHGLAVDLNPSELFAVAPAAMPSSLVFIADAAHQAAIACHTRCTVQLRSTVPTPASASAWLTPAWLT